MPFEFADFELMRPELPGCMLHVGASTRMYTCVRCPHGQAPFAVPAVLEL